MSKRLAFLCLAAAALLLPCAAPALGAADESTPAQKISLNLENVPVEELLVKVSELTNVPYIIVGEIPADLRVTVKFVNAGVNVTLMAVHDACADVGLSVRAHQEGILVRVPPGRAPGSPKARAPARAVGPQMTTARSLLSQHLTQDVHLALAELIDFEVEDVPFREALAQLLRQLPEPVDFTVIVDESVPSEMRTTARVRKMPLHWVLDNLIMQSNLKVSVAPREVGPQGEPLPLVIYLVPQPELVVSGPGVTE